MPADIRRATASDIDALTAIENAVFETDRMSRRAFRRFVRADTAAVLVAEAASRLAAYCVVLFRRGSGTARLYSIAAAPGGERNGYGRALLDAAERVAIGRGCASLRLEVRADNDRASELYERNGYHRIGEVPGYYADGATAFRYQKQLHAAEADAGTPLHAKRKTA